VARAVLTAIEIHSQVLFLPSGSVYKWTDRVGREIATSCKAESLHSEARRPRTRTGKMTRSIKKEKIKGTLAAKTLSCNVSVNVRYAKYVLGGTANNGSGYIYSRAGWPNRTKITGYITRVRHARESNSDIDLPDTPDNWWMSTPYGPYMRVRGQKANPFMTRGYNLVARKHAALRPIRSRFLT
jgi:hypothetical protein